MRILSTIFSPLAFMLVVLSVYAWRIAGGDATGWDTSSHLMLTHLLADNLSEGRVIAYRTEWFGGFPAFALYPPGFYLYALIPHYVSFGALSIDDSFQLMIAIIPILILLAFTLCARLYIGRSAARYAPFIASFFFFYPPFYSHLGLGLSGIFAIGFLPQSLALALCLLFLALLAGPPTLARALAAGIVLTALTLTHLITALFAGFLLVLLLLFHMKSLKWWLLAVLAMCVAGLLSYPWLTHFLDHLPHSASESIGLGNLADPLLVLFPGFSIQHFSFMLSAPHYSLIVGENLISLAALIVDFPIIALCVLLLAPLALRHCFRSKEAFVLLLMFFFTLLVLPRNIGPSILPFGMHYYRFTPHVFLLALLCLCAAFQQPQLLLGPSKASALRAALPKGLVLFSVLFLLVVQFRLYTDDRAWRTDRAVFRPSFDQYLLRDAAIELESFLSTQQDIQRLAVQSSTYLANHLGSPHYFTATLPITHGIDVVPGLLAESTLSSDFINSTLVALDRSLAVQQGHLGWGQRSVLRNRSFLQQKPNFYAAKLAELGVSHYLATTSDTIRALQESTDANEFVLRWSNDAFALFEIAERPVLRVAMERLPFAFYSNNRMAFQHFATGYFSSTSSPSLPVVQSPLSLGETVEQVGERFIGLIYQCPTSRRIPEEDLIQLRLIADSVLLFGCLPKFVAHDAFLVIPNISEEAFTRELQIMLERMRKKSGPQSLITTEQLEIWKWSYTQLPVQGVNSSHMYRVTPNFQLRIAQ